MLYLTHNRNFSKMGEMPNDKYFSEKEVAEIIRRAGEIQEEKAVGGYAPGVAADELKKLALEVGIQPEYLEQALQERGRTTTTTTQDKNSVERFVPVEVDPEDFDMITDALTLRPINSASSSSSGGVSQFGRTVVGRASEAWDNPHFKINSRGGRTKIEVWSDKSVPFAAGFLWIVPLMLSPVVAKVSGPLWGVLVAIVMCIFAVLSYRALEKKSQVACAAVADKLEKAILEYGENKKSELATRLESTTAVADVVGQQVSE